jgi:hypothetical protein
MIFFVGIVKIGGSLYRFQSACWTLTLPPLINPMTFCNPIKQVKRSGA